MKVKFQFTRLSRAYTGEAEGALQYVFVDGKCYSLPTTIHKDENGIEFQPEIGDGDEWLARDENDNVAEFSKTKAWERFTSWFAFDASYRNYTEAKKHIKENVTRLITDFYDGKVLCECCYGDGQIFISEGVFIDDKLRHHFVCEECYGTGAVKENAIKA